MSQKQFCRSVALYSQKVEGRNFFIKRVAASPKPPMESSEYYDAITTPVSLMYILSMKYSGNGTCV